MDDYLFLLGLSEEELDSIFSTKEPSSKFQLTYTCSPRPKERKMDKRVIRVQNRNGILNILVGYFEQPYYKP